MRVCSLNQMYDGNIIAFLILIEYLYIWKKKRREAADERFELKISI